MKRNLFLIIASLSLLILSSTSFSFEKNCQIFMFENAKGINREEFKTDLLIALQDRGILVEVNDPASNIEIAEIDSTKNVVVVCSDTILLSRDEVKEAIVSKFGQDMFLGICSLGSLCAKTTEKIRNWCLKNIIEPLRAINH